MTSYFTNSSLLGVDFNSPSTTALFGLNSQALGSNDSMFQYCIATGTLTTGQLVQISVQGTAIAITTAILGASAPVSMDIGLAQYTVAQGSFCWIAKRGQGLYVQCTGTLPTTVGLGLSPTAGTLQTSLAVGLTMTAGGIFLETSASTATLSITTCTLQWPRFLTVSTSVVG